MDRLASELPMYVGLRGPTNKGRLSHAHLGEPFIDRLRRISVRFRIAFFLSEHMLGGNTLSVDSLALTARFRRPSVSLRGLSVDLRG